MTTNLLTALILVGATNWTGYLRDGRELGLVETNHVLRVEYAGQTNEFKLLSVPTDIVVWRGALVITNSHFEFNPATNFYVYSNLFWMDNQ